METTGQRLTTGRLGPCRFAHDDGARIPHPARVSAGPPAWCERDGDERIAGRRGGTD